MRNVVVLQPYIYDGLKKCLPVLNVGCDLLLNAPEKRMAQLISHGYDHTTQ